jgi:nitric oxide reductase subunit B
VVPLVLIGFEGYENLTLAKARPWVTAYKWPIFFFVAVAFWNLVGAGLFGFFINPPIALYYMQGLNTTPVHGHTALFGVYGMLGIGLMLFCLKGLAAHRSWNSGPVKFSFWAINIGLSLMVLLSLLPIGLMQTWASVQHGIWYARSAEFTQTGVMDTLRWMRVVGDSIFALGALSLGYFVLGLKTGWSFGGGGDELNLGGAGLTGPGGKPGTAGRVAAPEAGPAGAYVARDDQGAIDNRWSEDEDRPAPSRRAPDREPPGQGGP